MRKINKKQPPVSFEKFLRENPKAVWNDIHKGPNQAVYEEVRQVISEEQSDLCGYTELILDKYMHLDHFKKRDHFPSPKDIFDWNNLIAAIKSDVFGADYKDNVYRIQKDEYASILNPVFDVAEDFFEYNALGEIFPKANLSAADKTKAEKTIEVFNLNHPSLVERRKNHYRMISDCSALGKGVIRECFSGSEFVSMLNQLLDDFS